jgi:hypothetical protein
MKKYRFFYHVLTAQDPVPIFNHWQVDLLAENLSDALVLFTINARGYHGTNINQANIDQIHTDEKSFYPRPSTAPEKE